MPVERPAEKAPALVIGVEPVQALAQLPAEPSGPILVYCNECQHFRYTKGSAGLGFDPLCAAVHVNYLSRDGAISFAHCMDINPEGHCKYYAADSQPRPAHAGFWNWIF